MSSSYKEQYHGKYGDDRYWDEPLRSVDDSSDFDREEIDRAIALSLLEEDRKRKKVIDERLARAKEDERRARAEEVEKYLRAQLEEDERRARAEENERRARAEENERRARAEEDEKYLRAQLEEDEQLAEALQESLNVDSPHHYDFGNAFSPYSFLFPSRYRDEEEERHARAEEDKKHLTAQLEEDEQLAKVLQESLNVDSPPQYDFGNALSPCSFLFPSRYRICAGCNAEIIHGRFLSFKGAVWHPACFRCPDCNQPFTNYEFSMSGNRPYHKTCHKEPHHPRCDVCNNFIPTNSSGLIENRVHPFWLQKYCPSHERDGTPCCCSCERMESRDTRYLSLDDGRKLCLECLDSAIMDTRECQPLYLEIQEFYEGLNMKLEQEIPLLLVERQALNEAMEGEKNGHHHLSETRGLCLSEEHTITTVSRGPRIGAGYHFIDLITEPYRLSRRCEVTAILILYGLPRLLTGSILAHEMMHAWLRLKGYPNLCPEVEEGICQVLAHMWLDSEFYSSSRDGVSSSSSSPSPSSSTSSKKGKWSDFEKKLGECFNHQIESDASSAYGDGFRSGNQAVRKFGLRSTLEHIRLTGTFPVSDFTD